VWPVVASVSEFDICLGSVRI